MPDGRVSVWRRPIESYVQLIFGSDEFGQADWKQTLVRRPTLSYVYFSTALPSLSTSVGAPAAFRVTWKSVTGVEPFTAEI